VIDDFSSVEPSLDDQRISNGMRHGSVETENIRIIKELNERKQKL
jgi:hypothetical protein